MERIDRTFYGLTLNYLKLSLVVVILNGRTNEGNIACSIKLCRKRMKYIYILSAVVD